MSADDIRPAAASGWSDSAARRAPAECRDSIPGAPTWRRSGPFSSKRCSTGSSAEEITLCDFALREGLVLDYIRRNSRHIRTAERYPDVRRRSVDRTGRTMQLPPGPCAQVAKLSLALFDATKDRHKLGAREREWLEFGALLHDIGTHINYEGHHKHCLLPDSPRRAPRLRSRWRSKSSAWSPDTIGRRRRRNRTKATSALPRRLRRHGASAGRARPARGGAGPQPRAGHHGG